MATLQSPTHVAVDGAGNLYVLSGVSPAVAVHKVASDGSISPLVGPVPNAPPFSALAADRAENIYVITASLPESLGGGGGRGHGAVLKFDGQGRAQTFTQPERNLSFARALAVDSAGNVWIRPDKVSTVRPEVVPTVLRYRRKGSRGLRYLSPNGNLDFIGQKQ